MQQTETGVKRRDMCAKQSGSQHQQSITHLKQPDRQLQQSITQIKPAMRPIKFGRT